MVAVVDEAEDADDDEVVGGYEEGGFVVLEVVAEATAGECRVCEKWFWAAAATAVAVAVVV